MKDELKQTFDNTKRLWNSYEKELNKLLSKINKPKEFVHDVFHESKSYKEFNKKLKW